MVTPHGHLGWGGALFGCAILVFAAVQYAFGGVRINNSFGWSWFTRKDDPNAFWFWLSVQIFCGLVVIGISVADAH